MPSFEPTLHAARQCIDHIQPDAYARTRNALDGAVTRVSPFLTHGFLSLADVYTAANARHALPDQHKLVFELGWRAYYRHVWAHLGEGIHLSLHAGVLPEEAYHADMPHDVLEARTGIPAIDQAVRALYTTGYVHNHARMWLASYLVHLRKVHWRTGANWMWGHLLDGDLASNHLSWQWVAGTGSSKPYVFNADNVAKYAPAHWHSPASVLDVSYETLDEWARSPQARLSPLDTRRADNGMAMPALYDSPFAAGSEGISSETLASASAGPWQVAQGFDPQRLAGRDVWLHHPWSLGPPPASMPAGVDRSKLVQVGAGFAAFHADRPWSQRRWDFVTQGLRASADAAWPLLWGSVDHIAHALQHARSVHWQPEAHADPALAQLQALLRRSDPQRAAGPRASPCLFDPVSTYCPSFSTWWKATRLNDALATTNHLNVRSAMA